jgi:hypothetical protein
MKLVHYSAQPVTELVSREQYIDEVLERPDLVVKPRGWRAGRPSIVGRPTAALGSARGRQEEGPWVM